MKPPDGYENAAIKPALHPRERTVPWPLGEGRIHEQDTDFGRGNLVLNQVFHRALECLERSLAFARLFPAIRTPRHGFPFLLWRHAKLRPFRQLLGKPLRRNSLSSRVARYYRPDRSAACRLGKERPLDCDG